MNENFTIVIQGPWIKEMTERSIISIRENLGNTNIIMSTWQLGLLGKNFLIKNHVKLIENEDPGETEFRFFFEPKSAEAWKGISCNTNRQIVSTLMGIKAANTEICLN